MHTKTFIRTLLFVALPVCAFSQQIVYYNDSEAAKYLIKQPGQGFYLLNAVQHSIVDSSGEYTSYDVIEKLGDDSLLVKTYSRDNILRFEGYFSAYVPGGKYVDQVRNGVQKYYNDSGDHLYYSETWRVNKLDGELRTYYPGGALKRIEHWKDGLFVDGQCFNEDGSARQFTRFQLAPEFPGGEEKMMRYVSNNIKYPKKAKKRGVQGTAVVSFVVNKDGSISDIRILKDPGEGCGEEAARVVREMPKWNPGSMDDHPVKVRYTFPLRFRLD